MHQPHSKLVFEHPKFLADGKVNPLAATADFAQVFIDDILAFSKIAEEHVGHVNIVIDALHQDSLLIRMSKCSWGQTELPYLGHIVSKDGIKVDPKMIEAVASWPEPTNLNEIQQFLAVTNFFRKYIQGYTNSTMPLTVLLKKNTPCYWNPACENSFAGLKTALTSAPCLALPDTSEGSPTFDLQVCDASGFGLGAVLIKQGRPIAFWSRKLVPAEQNHRITE